MSRAIGHKRPGWSLPGTLCLLLLCATAAAARTPARPPFQRVVRQEPAQAARLEPGQAAWQEPAQAAQQAGQEVAEQKSPKDLPPDYRQWLEESVVYIISPIERQAFLMLDSDAERDAFIDAFWRNRDPTPGTVKNEAREEHQRRITYANRYLGTETPRRGWQTDRGRIYIQLGEPAEKQSYPDPRSFYPIELWFYRSEPGTTGLPPFFYVMFYRPVQAGEFKMYDPITDGPGVLVKDFLLQMDDPRQIVGKMLMDLGHEVATASINLIPTEPTSFARPRPSARNSFLFAAIDEAPFKRIDVGYARDFVASRGEVEAAVVFDTMPVELAGVAFWDERGLPYLHYGVEVPKEKVLLGQYESDYYVSLRLGLEVDDPRGQQVLLGGDDIEDHFDEERAQQVLAAPLAYYDRVELVPGVYDLSVSLNNRVNGDTSVQKVRLSVPLASGDHIAASDLLVASAALPAERPPAGQDLPAFRFGDEQLLPAAGGRLPVGGTVELFMQIVATPDIAAGATVGVVAMLVDEEGNEVASAEAPPVPVAAFPVPTPLRVSLPLTGAQMGSHTVRLIAMLSDGQRLSREAPVEIVSRPAFRRPEILLTREVRLEGVEEYRRRGWQHQRKGELRAAETYMSAALAQEPDNAGLRRSLAGIEINLGEHEAAVAVIRPAATLPSANAIDMLIYSQALRGAGSPDEAAAVARALLQRGPTTPAYNALAGALVDLGNIPEAIAAYQASLAINPDQPEVREALARLRDPGGKDDYPRASR